MLKIHEHSNDVSLFCLQVSILATGSLTSPDGATCSSEMSVVALIGSLRGFVLPQASSEHSFYRTTCVQSYGKAMNNLEGIDIISRICQKMSFIALAHHGNDGDYISAFSLVDDFFSPNWLTHLLFPETEHFE